MEEKDTGKLIQVKGWGVLLLKRINRILPVYAADISGVCSASMNWESMTVMHDASAATPHIPPTMSRDGIPWTAWFTYPPCPSWEAVMGDDDKLVRDIVDAARNLHPRFICLGGTPFP